MFTFFLLIELKGVSPAASISIYNLIFSIVVCVFNSPFKAPYNILDSVAEHIIFYWQRLRFAV